MNYTFDLVNYNFDFILPLGLKSVCQVKRDL